MIHVPPVRLALQTPPSSHALSMWGGVAVVKTCTKHDLLVEQWQRVDTAIGVEGRVKDPDHLVHVACAVCMCGLCIWHGARACGLRRVRQALLP